MFGTELKDLKGNETIALECAKDFYRFSEVEVIKTGEYIYRSVGPTSYGWEFRLFGAVSDRWSFFCHEDEKWLGHTILSNPMWWGRFWADQVGHFYHFEAKRIAKRHEWVVFRCYDAYRSLVGTFAKNLTSGTCIRGQKAEKLWEGEAEIITPPEKPQWKERTYWR